jgi:hypothetical protein
MSAWTRRRADVRCPSCARCPESENPGRPVLARCCNSVWCRCVAARVTLQRDVALRCRWVAAAGRAVRFQLRHSWRNVSAFAGQTGCSSTVGCEYSPRQARKSQALPGLAQRTADCGSAASRPRGALLELVVRVDGEAAAEHGGRATIPVVEGVGHIGRMPVVVEDIQQAAGEREVLDAAP